MRRGGTPSYEPLYLPRHCRLKCPDLPSRAPSSRRLSSSFTPHVGNRSIPAPCTRPRRPNHPPTLLISARLSLHVTSMARGRQSPVSVSVAAVVAIAAAAAVASPAAAGYSFFPSRVGDIGWSVSHVLRNSRGGVKTVPGTRRLLPTCSVGACCDLLPVEDGSAGFFVGARPARSDLVHRPTSSTYCPLAFGFMMVTEVPSAGARRDEVAIGGYVV